MCADRYSRDVAKRRRWGERWEWVEDLGEGGQAHTFLVRDLTDESTGWVLKRLKNPKRLERFKREVEALIRLKSPNIPSVKDYAISKEKGKSYLVTRYVGTDFTQLPEVVEPQLLLERFRGIVVAVHDAHAKGVIHRDIKPDNATVDEDGTPYLVDFGICAVDEVSQVVLTTTMEAFGNRSFAAPECDAGSVDDCREPSDVYSFGKLLYWMASGKQVFSRENFDRDKLIIGDLHARQYISLIIEHTVFEDPGARWTVTDLRDRVNWALDKLREHSEIRATGLMVVADGFGPKNECYEGSHLSVTTPPRGNPPADHDVAEAFFVKDAVTLEQLDIAVKLIHGLGQAEVILVKGDFAGPSEDEEDEVERWPVEINAPETLQVLRLQSSSKPTLGPREIYWVILSTNDPDSEIAWISSPLQLMRRVSHTAERDRPNEWQPQVSDSGPGQSLRVLAR